MADRPKGAEGVKEFFWLFHQIVHLALWLMLMLCFAIAADLVAAHYVWTDDPVSGIQDLIQFYIDQSTAPDLSARAAQLTYDAMFGWNGVDRAARNAALGITSGGAFSEHISEMLFTGNLRPYTIVAMYGAKLFGVRAAMLAMVLPQFGLILLLALVDGLVARYVRRACGGNESATLFHRAKRWTTMGLVPLVMLVWLVAPVPLYVHWLFFPVVLAAAAAVWMMARFYKKYL
ncbi:DUF4400 domain-containing protein [Paraburkholderia tropica]|uniref:DUF4400 domain-containing protein n=1 Tax=Paraburkholderia tropica TaxID=92647 RepID=UPI002AB741D1|nr:DUF4400 domain-containing protein [Paraburkholderia tropica]